MPKAQLVQSQPDEGRGALGGYGVAGGKGTGTIGEMVSGGGVGEMVRGGGGYNPGQPLKCQICPIVLQTS